MPPMSSHIKPSNESPLYNDGTSTAHAQPKAIYITEEIHFGQFTQNNLKIIPPRDNSQTAAKRIIPMPSRNIVRQIGVY